jgi:hypothetical protein
MMDAQNEAARRKRAGQLLPLRRSLDGATNKVIKITLLVAPLFCPALRDRSLQELKD